MTAQTRTGPTRILYVEDDDDIRELIAGVLGEAGYQVTVAASAESARMELERGEFELLLTDYQLPPGEDAAWLIKDAREGGRLESTPVLILTAMQHPPGLEGYRVLRKPLDLDTLLGAVGQAIHGPLSRHAPIYAPPGLAAPPIVLVLYLTGDSHHSANALRNVRRALQRFDSSQVTLEIRDIAQAQSDPELARALEEDRIVVTPTLVRLHPTPKRWIVGDLSREDFLDDVIGDLRALSDRPPAVAAVS